MKKTFYLFLLAGALITLTACTSSSETNADEQTYTLKIAHSSAATDDRLENSLQVFKENIESASEGRIIIETYPGSQLGGEREALEGIQMGSIEMGVISNAPFGGFFEEMTVLDLPYVFENEQISDEVLDGEFGDELFDRMLEETGIRGLAWGENGIRHVATNDKAVESPEDLNGMQIRSQENPVHLNMIRSFGGSPTAIPFPELYSSLQQGVIDGYENPFSLIEGMGFYDVTDYISLTAHVNGVYSFVINESVYQSLPEDLQIILQEEATKWSDIEREMNREQEREGRTHIESTGVEVIELSEEQIDEFKKASEPVVEQQVENIGGDIYELLQEAISEVENEN